MHAAYQHTMDEYVDLDDHTDAKLEFWHGLIVAMAEGGVSHNRICLNVIRLLATALRGTPCEPFGSDQRVRLSDDVFVYPDITVACEPIVQGHGLTNPTALIEVLSPSTEQADRTQKLPMYRNLDGVNDVVLIRQDRIEVEWWHRSEHGWAMKTLVGGDIDLDGVVLPLNEVYERVLD